MNWLAKNGTRLASLTFTAALSIGAANVQGQGTPNITWQQQQNSDRINSVVFSPDGQTLITGSSDRLINFWRASDGALTQTLNSNATKVHESSVEWLAISSDGSRLASCSYRMVKLWRLPGGTEQQLNGHTDWVVGVAFSPGGTYLASASFDGTVRIWRGSDGSSVKTINIGGEVRSVSFSPNGQYLASGSGDGTVRIWQTSDWSLAKTLTGHTADIYVLTFSPDGASLASGGYDHTARVWNTSTWANRYTISASGNVYALAFTRDSQQLGLSDGESNHIELHRVSDGALLRRYDQAVNNVQSIAFSQGAMAYGRADATVVLASLSTTTPPPVQPPPPVKTNPPPVVVVTNPPPVVTNPPPVVVTPPPSTGDNPLNIVWQHGNGALSYWAMDGTNHVGTFKINDGRSAGATWRVLGLGNFNTEANDFVSQNVNGAAAIWVMSGAHTAGAAPVRDGRKPDPRWRIAGVGDFNGDGQRDLLFQTAAGALRAWLMNGTEYVDTTELLDGERLARGWRVAGVDDFNHDGNPDLVLESTRGGVEIQLMDGTEPVDLIALFNGLPQARNWRIAGTADFNGDGETDLLLQSNSGYVAVWFMKGTRFYRSVLINDGKRATGGWRIVGVTR